MALVNDVDDFFVQPDKSVASSRSPKLTAFEFDNLVPQVFDYAEPTAEDLDDLLGCTARVPSEDDFAVPSSTNFPVHELALPDHELVPIDTTLLLPGYCGSDCSAQEDYFARKHIDTPSLTFPCAAECTSPVSLSLTPPSKLPSPPIAPGYPVCSTTISPTLDQHCVPTYSKIKPLTLPSVVAVQTASPLSPAPSSQAAQPKATRKRRAPALASVPDEALNEEQLAKRMRRRQRNKESAQQSRQRKKLFVDELTDKVEQLTQENDALRLQVRSVLAENELFKRTLHTHNIPIPKLSQHAS